MEKEKWIMDVLQRVAEVDVPAHSIELWPRIGSQVSAIVSRRSRAARSQIIIGIAVVMAIGILGFVSPVHGMLEAMWQHLNLE